MSNFTKFRPIHFKFSICMMYLFQILYLCSQKSRDMAMNENMKKAVSMLNSSSMGKNISSMEGFLPIINSQGNQGDKTFAREHFI